MRSSALIVLLAVAFPSLAEDVVEIPVVRTFEELSKAPEIALASGEKVRVGIEANTAPVGAQVLVYVLASGVNTDEDLGVRERRIGPLQIQIEGEALPEDKLKKVEESSLVDAGLKLWCNSVAVGKDGVSFDLEEPIEGGLASRVPEPLAKAKISASMVEFHPWRELGFPDEAEKVQELSESDVSVLRVNTGEQCRVQPVIEGTVPVLPVDDECLKSKDRLPHLLTCDDVGCREKPTKAQTAAVDRLVEKLSSDEFDERDMASRELQSMAASLPGYLHVKLEASNDPEARSRLKEILNGSEGEILIGWAENTIRVRFPHLTVFEGSREKFLFRWWLNGKPVALEDHAIELEKIEALAEIRGVNVELVDFDAKSLGAKSGDLITVQVMHAPHGSSPLNQKRERAVLRDQIDAIDACPRISNKISITVK